MKQQLTIEDLAVLMCVTEKAIDRDIEIFLDVKTSISGNQYFTISAQDSPRKPLESCILPKEGELFDELLSKGKKLLYDYTKLTKLERLDSKFHNLVTEVEKLTGMRVIA